MKKNIKSFSILSIMILSLIVLSTGCSSNKRGNTNNNIPSNEEGLTPNQPGDLDGDRNINKGTITDSEQNDMTNDNLDNNKLDDNAMTERSKTLAKKLNELNEVNNANVLITANTALIGIDIPKDASNESVTNIKNTVENKVKEVDREIDRVVVTADADLVTRMKNVGKDIESGKPISGFTNEIEEIIKRITPNM